MQLPEGVQRFLRRTAVLDQLCAPLCDADPRRAGLRRRSFATWRRRACSWSRWIVGAGGIATTRCSGSSCSASFAASSPTSSSKLHLRAADWYEANGSPALALEHLLNTTERDRCVQLVTELVLPTYQSGQLSTVQRWLSTLARCRRGVSPARGAGRMDRGADRADRRSATVGGVRRHRLVRPDARGRHGLVRLGAGHAAGADVCRRSRADGDRRKLRGRRGAAVERMARHGTVLVCRGAAAPRRP